MAERLTHELLILTDYRWLNANDRSLWFQRWKLTRQWRALTHLLAVRDKLPRIEKAQVVCELRFTDSRRRDPANWAPTAKACIDGLVDAGVFADDDHTHVIGPDMRIGEKVLPAGRGVRLLIHPLES